MTLQRFVKLTQDYLDIDNECQDVSTTQLAKDTCKFAFESLSKDDQHAIRVLCDARIADIIF